MQEKEKQDKEKQEKEKICQSLKIPKTGYANREEFMKNIFEFLNEKSDLKDISVINQLSKNYL